MFVDDIPTWGPPQDWNTILDQLSWAELTDQTSPISTLEGASTQHTAGRRIRALASARCTRVPHQRRLHLSWAKPHHTGSEQTTPHPSHSPLPILRTQAPTFPLRFVAALRCLCLGLKPSRLRSRTSTFFAALQDALTFRQPLTTDGVWRACRKAELEGFPIRSPNSFGAQTGAHLAALTAVRRPRQAVFNVDFNHASFGGRLNDATDDLQCKGLITLGNQTVPPVRRSKPSTNVRPHTRLTPMTTSRAGSRGHHRYKGSGPKLQDCSSSRSWPTTGHPYSLTSNAGTWNVLAHCLALFGQPLPLPTTHTTLGSTTTPSASSSDAHWNSGRTPLHDASRTALARTI